MKTLLRTALLVSLVLPAAASGDDFQREGKNRDVKDAMEGKAPPALNVENWINTDGKPLDLAALKGKVVVIDFWGTW